LIMINFLTAYFLIVGSAFQMHFTGIKKAWMFSQKIYAGNIPIAPNGQPGKNQSNSLMLIIEVNKNSKLPKWQILKLDSINLDIASIIAIPDSALVYHVKNASSPLIVKAEAGTKLLKLVINDTGTIRPYYDKVSLKGRIGRHVAREDIPQLSIVELSPQYLP
jgi:hypothetical protein